MLDYSLKPTTFSCFSTKLEVRQVSN